MNTLDTAHLVQKYYYSITRMQKSIAITCYNNVEYFQKLSGFNFVRLASYKVTIYLQEKRITKYLN